MAYYQLPRGREAFFVRNKASREAEMLRTARLRMGYSQQEVANVIGIG